MLLQPQKGLSFGGGGDIARLAPFLEAMMWLELISFLLRIKEYAIADVRNMNLQPEHAANHPSMSAGKNSSPLSHMSYQYHHCNGTVRLPTWYYIFVDMVLFVRRPDLFECRTVGSDPMFGYTVTRQISHGTKTQLPRFLRPCDSIPALVLPSPDSAE